MATLSEALSAALDHHAAGRLREAEILYGRILAARPNQPDARHLLGLALAQGGRAEEGLGHVDAAITANPNAPAYHLSQGKLRDALGRPGAEDSYRAALTRQPDLPEAAERLGTLLRQRADLAFDTGRFEQAEALYRRVLGLAPQDAAAGFDRAMAIKHSGLPLAAAQALGHVARLTPALERAHLEQADALRAGGKLSEAAEAYRGAVTVEPGRTTSWWALAVTCQQAGAGARSVPAYRVFLSMEPADGGGWNNLSVALREARQHGAAVAAGRRAALTVPDGDAALVNLSSAQHAAEAYHPAANASRRALGLAPASADALMNLGASLDELHASMDAERALLRCLRLRPGDALALAQLGRVRERAGGASADGTLRRALAALPADEEGWAALGRARLRLGDLAEALICAQRALTVQPDLPTGLLVKGAVLEAGGNAEGQALAVYDRVIRVAPGVGAAFTRRAILRLRAVVSAPPPRTSSGGPRLLASQLGRAGRFGNQILQYAFLKTHAERHGLDLETPDWIGRPLYGFDDPLPGQPLPFLSENEHDLAAMLTGPQPGLCVGRDVIGYFCGDLTPLSPQRARVRALFTPSPPVAARVDGAMAALRRQGRTVVALHLRRGDFGVGRFWIAPDSWYLEWLAALWPTLEHPVLYIATDEPSVIGAFAAYAPLRADDLAPPLPGAEFFIDHWVLSRADALAVSNSSFSVTAALLNPQALAMVRPDRQAGRLVPFDPWSGPALLD